MSWDSSRISAAIPSGVGFLGSALIFKHKDDQSNIHEVHGLTTAASVWLSAAVGIACAGGMYYIASLSCAVMLVLLRFGPRTNIPLEEINQEEEHSDDEELADIVADKLEGGGGGATTTPKHISYQTNPVNPETQQLILPRPSTSASLRSTGTRKSNQTPRGQNHRPSLI